MLSELPDSAWKEILEPRTSVASFVSPVWTTVHLGPGRIAELRKFFEALGYRVSTVDLTEEPRSVDEPRVSD